MDCIPITCLHQFRLGSITIQTPKQRKKLEKQKQERLDKQLCSLNLIRLPPLRGLEKASKKRSSNKAAMAAQGKFGFITPHFL